MPQFTLRQLQHESDAWKRVLVFMGEENVELKNRLSEILKSDIDKKLLLKAENFQNGFVAEDDLIRFLRNDIAVFDRLINRGNLEDGVVILELTEKLRIIRASLINTEKRFNDLKLEFNNYMLQYTSSR